MLGIYTGRACTEMFQLPCTRMYLIKPSRRYSYNLRGVRWSVQAMIPASDLTSRTMRCSPVRLGLCQLPQLCWKNSNPDFTKEGFAAEGAGLLRATWKHLGTGRTEVPVHSYCIIMGYPVWEGHKELQSEEVVEETMFFSTECRSWSKQ